MTDRRSLTLFEQKEIQDFEQKSQVFFTGRDVNNKVQASHSEEEYDDKDGNYTINLGDHLYYRFEIVEELGKGSFGKVVKVFDHKKKFEVAIKIVKNRNAEHHASRREVKLLHKLSMSPDFNQSNITYLLSHFYFRGHLCIVLQLLYNNLYTFLKQNNYRIPMILVKQFSKDILTALTFLKNEKIIHCDIKPENMLLKVATPPSALIPLAQMHVKLCDFGAGRIDVGVDSNTRWQWYLQSRFYRAPEMMLDLPYDCGIDMYSFGCVIPELLHGYPLFPGDTEEEQLHRLMAILGPPPQHMLANSHRAHLLLEEGGGLKKWTGKSRRGNIGTPGSVKWSEFLRSEDSLLIDFVRQLVTWDPRRRMTPEQAMAHPFLSNEDFTTTGSSSDSGMELDDDIAAKGGVGQRLTQQQLDSLPQFKEKRRKSKKKNENAPATAQATAAQSQQQQQQQQQQQAHTHAQTQGPMGTLPDGFVNSSSAPGFVALQQQIAAPTPNGMTPVLIPNAWLQMLQMTFPFVAPSNFMEHPKQSSDQIMSTVPSTQIPMPASSSSSSASQPGPSSGGAFLPHVPMAAPFSSSASASEHALSASKQQQPQQMGSGSISFPPGFGPSLPATGPYSQNKGGSGSSSQNTSGRSTKSNSAATTPFSQQLFNLNGAAASGVSLGDYQEQHQQQLMNMLHMHPYMQQQQQQFMQMQMMMMQRQPQQMQQGPSSSSSMDSPFKVAGNQITAPSHPPAYATASLQAPNASVGPNAGGGSHHASAAMNASSVLSSGGSIQIGRMRRNQKNTSVGGGSSDSNSTGASSTFKSRSPQVDGIEFTDNVKGPNVGSPVNAQNAHLPGVQGASGAAVTVAPAASGKIRGNNFNSQLSSLHPLHSTGVNRTQTNNSGGW